MSNHAAPFPRLRTAYLRATARAWREPDYEKRLFEVSRDNPRGALPMLEEEYNFRFPFLVKFAIEGGERRPVYRPIGTSSWFGFGDEFKIPLPEQPEDPADQATALALYCQNFPSLLGAATDGVSEAPPDFAEFGVITARLLALAWKDEAFKRRLFAAEDARDLVQGAMNYIVQWNFRLKFYETGIRARPMPEGRKEAFEKLPYSTIVVYLPRRPEQSDIEAVALAAYNDTGSQYPFTCA